MVFRMGISYGTIFLEKRCIESSWKIKNYEFYLCIGFYCQLNVHFTRLGLFEDALLIKEYAWLLISVLKFEFLNLIWMLPYINDNLAGYKILRSFGVFCFVCFFVYCSSLDDPLLLSLKYFKTGTHFELLSLLLYP